MSVADHGYFVLSCVGRNAMLYGLFETHRLEGADMSPKGKVLSTEIIHLDWEGPWTVAQVLKAKSGNEVQKDHISRGYGVYQIYGTHAVTGPDSLLYVGRANGKTFQQRIEDHDDKWMQWEAEPVRIHFGRIVTNGGEQPSDERWGQMIDWAEALIIYFCSPAYNNASIRRLQYLQPEIVVVNHRRRGRLPNCITNLPEIAFPCGGGLEEVGTGRSPKPSPDAPKDDAVKRR